VSNEVAQLWFALSVKYRCVGGFIPSIWPSAFGVTREERVQIGGRGEGRNLQDRGSERGSFSPFSLLSSPLRRVCKGGRIKNKVKEAE